jgi:predicted nucleotidyltransferase
VFVDYEDVRTFNYFKMINLQDHLTKLLHREVDLTTHDGFLPFVMEEVKKDSIRVM